MVCWIKNLMTSSNGNFLSCARMETLQRQLGNISNQTWPWIPYWNDLWHSRWHGNEMKLRFFMRDYTHQMWQISKFESWHEIWYCFFRLKLTYMVAAYCSQNKRFVSCPSWKFTELFGTRNTTECVFNTLEKSSGVQNNKIIHQDLRERLPRVKSLTHGEVSQGNMRNHYVSHSAI